MGEGKILFSSLKSLDKTDNQGNEARSQTGIVITMVNMKRKEEEKAKNCSQPASQGAIIILSFSVTPLFGEGNQLA